MQIKCICGKKVHSYQCYEDERSNRIVYYYVCHHCRKTMSAIREGNGNIKIIHGYFGPVYQR